MRVIDDQKVCTLTGDRTANTVSSDSWGSSNEGRLYIFEGGNETLVNREAGSVTETTLSTNASGALAQANAQLLHHVKTAEGRVAAMQREFQQAKTAQQSVAPQDAPSQGQIATAAKNPEKWEQLKSDFPEWAGAMEEYVASKLGGIAKQQNAGLTSQQVEALVAERVNQTKAEVARQLEEARIEGKHDDWRSTVNTPEFAAWYSASASGESTAPRHGYSGTSSCACSTEGGSRSRSRSSPRCSRSRCSGSRSAWRSSPWQASASPSRRRMKAVPHG